MGLLSATLVVFVRDLKEVVGIILQLWFWFTPIVYVSDILPDFAKKVAMFSPAYIITEAYHRIFVFQAYPTISSMVILTIIAHFLLIASYLLFRFLEKDVRDFV